MLALAALAAVLPIVLSDRDDPPATPKIQRCYSCSSPHLDMRWPKGEDNKLQYLRQFPLFWNESCEHMKRRLPVVDCPNSVCIKAVIKQSPRGQELCGRSLEASEGCVAGRAIVRDCWSRVMHLDAFALAPPKTKRDTVRLLDPATEDEPELTVGYIYTCSGYLCNAACRTSNLGHLLYLCLALYFLTC